MSSFVEQNDIALQEAERQEKETLISAWMEHERIEKENQERIRQRNLSYQNHLDMQIDYQNQVKEKEKDEDTQEFLQGKVGCLFGNAICSPNKDLKT